MTPIQTAIEFCKEWVIHYRKLALNGDRSEKQEIIQDTYLLMQAYLETLLPAESTLISNEQEQSELWQEIVDDINDYDRNAVFSLPVLNMKSKYTIIKKK